MANATKYVDNVNGNNANTGDSEAQAYADIPTAVAAITGGGNRIYVQAGSNYTLTATITLSTGGTEADGPNVIEGYTTTPGARDGRPVITSATNSVVLFTCTALDRWRFEHLKLTHTAGTRGDAFTTPNVSPGCSNLVWDDCVIDGCRYALYFDYAATYTLDRGLLTGCEIKNCTSGGVQISAGINLFNCDVHDNTGAGVTIGNGLSSTNLQTTLSHCRIYANTGDGVLVSVNKPHLVVIDHCNFHGNGGDGFDSDQTSTAIGLWVTNTAFTSNGGYGVNLPDLPAGLVNRCNAYRSNTSGARLNLPTGTGDVTLTADPYTNAGTGDFTLNTTAGGGAAMRAAGVPAYTDIGSRQHQDAGGGGGGGDLGLIVQARQLIGY